MYLLQSIYKRKKTELLFFYSYFWIWLPKIFLNNTITYKPCHNPAHIILKIKSQYILSMDLLLIYALEIFDCPLLVIVYCATTYIFPNILFVFPLPVLSNWHNLFSQLVLFIYFSPTPHLHSLFLLPVMDLHTS